MSLRAVVVDDELLARQLLTLLLADYDDVQIVAECGNGAEAIGYLQSHPVDLLFLDIQMPRISGLDVVQEIGMLHLPPTIFVTAHQEHAVHAFEVQAIDYLTKPVDPQRLRQAMERVRERFAAKAALLTQAQFSAVISELRTISGESRSYALRFLVRDGVKDILLPTEAIEWIEAADYYSSLHSKDRTYMLRETITDLSKKLNPAIFVRVHRSAIVNLNHLREIYREGPDEGTIVLLNGHRLKMSRTGRQKLNQIGHS